MKEYLKFGALFALILTACSEHQTMEQTIEVAMERVADGYISPSKAVEIANDFAVLIESPQEDTGSRSVTGNRHASSTKNVRDIRIANSRSENNLIYVVNYDDEAGFALISKKDISTPVLAFIDSGSYNDATASEIEGFQDFIDYANGHLNSPNGLPCIDSPLGASFDTTFIPRDSTFITPPREPYDHYKDHFIHTNWGQSGVFGELCPTKIAGCGPTALAMVLAYYEKPDTLTVTYDGSNRKVILDWTAIKEHLKEERFPYKPTRPFGGGLPIYENPDHDLWPECQYTQCTKESHEQISLLFRQLGYDLNAIYGSDGTSIRRTQIYEVSTSIYGFKAYPDVPYSRSYLKNHLDKQRPAVMFGNNEDSGHAWICDGYYYTQTDDTKVMYLHYNWGYEGRFNGFFRAGVFHLSPDYPDYTGISHCIIFL